MIEHDRNAPAGEVFDESAVISLTQLCEVCSVEQTLIEQLVEEGVLDPLLRPERTAVSLYQCAHHSYCDPPAG